MSPSIPALLVEKISAHAHHTPEAPVLLAPGRKAITYQQLLRQIESTAIFLIRTGIKPKDRVAVVLPNGPEMAATFLAVSAFCACAPLNPAYSADEFNFYLNDLHAKALILPAGMDSPARSIATQLNIPVLSLSVNPADPAGIFTLSGDLALAEPQSLQYARRDNVALVLHTSGTTSRPKIVPLTQENIAYSVVNIAETYALCPADRVLNMMPLFHIHGLIGALAATVSTGGSVICAPNLKQDEVLDWMAILAPTWYSAVPTIHQAMVGLARANSDKTAKIKLRFIRSSSSSLPPQVAQDLEAVFNAPVLEAYGMTEATHQICSNPLPPKARKFGSVGLPTGVTQVRIIDETGQTLASGVRGEIAIFGPNVTHGYENNPAANKSAFVDGWLRTGDQGIMDKEGYLFIQGRSKEMINRGGEKITPREIDDVLLQHPAIGQAVAFAVPHPTLGEDVAAAIVLRPDQTANAQEIRQFVAGKLSDFKVPRQIVFVPEIPKGPTGKIQRIGLADKLKSALEASNRASETNIPMTATESRIAAIWQEILEIEKVTAQDDFLALGGDSLRAARILMRINEKFGLDLSIPDLFNNSTVSDLAKLVTQAAQ